MLRYLRTDHTAPGEQFRTGDMIHNTAWHIAKAVENDQKSIAILREGGIVPHHPTDQPHPVGTEWTLTDGEWYESPIGTPEDIAAALEAAAAQAVIDARNALEVESWKGKVILATMPALTEGPLSALPGPNLIHQVNAFCEANLSPAEFERFHGTLVWKRNDQQLAALIPLTGLSEEEVDAWFVAARLVE